MDSVIPSSSSIIAAFLRGGHDVRAAANVAIAAPAQEDVELISSSSEFQDAPPAMSKGQKRRLQQVSTKSDRVKVMEWMIEEASRCGEKHIASKAVKNFPEMFRGTEKANLQKASRWWKARDAFLLLFKNGEGPIEKKSLSVNQDGPGRKRVQMKAVTGRGPKRQAWVEWLHMKLLEEFRRLKAARVKFSPKLLLAMARGILQSSVHPDFKATAMCPRDKNLIMDKLTHRWILTFQERFNIRICFQTGDSVAGHSRNESQQCN
jgi:hypothetical protein